MKDVSLLEGQAQLPAGHVGIIGRVVVKMGLDVDLEEQQEEQSGEAVLNLAFQDSGCGGDLTTFSLTGAGLLLVLGMSTNVRRPCMSA